MVARMWLNANVSFGLMWISIVFTVANHSGSSEFTSVCQIAYVYMTRILELKEYDIWASHPECDVRGNNL